MNRVTLKAKLVRNDCEKIAGATIVDLRAALYLEAEAVMADSKKNYVPVVSGALRNSGTVKMPTDNGKRVSIEFGYGGPAAPYAAIVHEYPKGYGQGKNKYLSQPLNAAITGMAQRIASRLRISASGRAGRRRNGRI